MTTTTFNSFGLTKVLSEALHPQYTTPTQIQAEAIPVALKGHDILGSAQTGTGKTMAFVVPMLNEIIKEERQGALILLPTRELASQVLSVIQTLLGRKINLQTALLIGGDSMSKQLKQLKARPQIIVGTPGRINDHLKRRSLNLSGTDFLVLDETDRMLDMGFGIQIESIIAAMPRNRQTLMFSATIPQNILKMANKYLKNPVRIEIARTEDNAVNITEDFTHVPEIKKFDVLKEEIEKRNGTMIIFVKTKSKAEKISKKITQETGETATYIHGDLRQNQRTQVIKKFKNYEYRILVATDLAARGLDIPHIEHVINYDLPQCPEDYTHRIGRTGRAGAAGYSLCMIGGEDKAKWKILQRYLGRDDKKPSTESKDEEKQQPKKRFFKRPFFKRKPSRHS